MIVKFLIAIIGLTILIASGIFSYISFEQTFGTGDIHVPEKSQTIATTTEKAVVPTTVATRAPSSVNKNTSSTNGSLEQQKPIAKKTVVTPGPLRVVEDIISKVQPEASTSLLTIRGIIEYTNRARLQNGALPALTENELLNKDAKLKLEDMFAKQYFEHESPTGVGPADLAKTVGYAYVIVGENLALGDFASDDTVVTAWMNSPGHRANILNTHYQEIGVAVGKGMYEGHETWIAVQSFGLPLSVCPTISTELKSQIEANNIGIARLRGSLDSKKIQIESTSPNDPSYNVYVGEFNALIPEYNTLVEATRVLVAEYNASVQAFNSCINVVGTSDTH